MDETCIICGEELPPESKAADMCDACIDKVFPPKDPNRDWALPEN